MTIEIMYKIVHILYLVFATIIVFLLTTRTQLLNKIPELISDVEDRKLTGKEKMALVVEYCGLLIPRLFKVVFNDKVIEQMAQNIYDDMKSYYMKKKSLNDNNPKDLKLYD